MIKDIELIKKDYYRNDPYFRKANLKLSLSKEQIEEFLRCKDDIEYFANNYCYIINPDKGREIIDLYDYQKDALKIVQEERFSILTMPRQSSKTTITSIYMAWFSIFNNDKRTAILANKQKTSTEIFDRVVLIFQLLPQFLKPGVDQLNITSIEFDNGSKISSSATSQSAVRGISANLLVIDECAFIGRGIWTAFYDSSYPTIAKGKDSKIIISSTPNGYNHYYNLWFDALAERNNFKPFTIQWDKVPGRDEAYKQRTIKDIGLRKWLSEYECVFETSEGGLFDSNKLRKVEIAKPTQTFFNDKFLIYEEPQKEDKQKNQREAQYIVVCDVGEGVDIDFSTVSVFKITDKRKYEQVAVYRDNNIEPTLFAHIIDKIYRMYNNAIVLVENNDVGYATLNTLLDELNCEMIYNDDNKRLGIRMTKKVKYIGITNARELVDLDTLIINDAETLKEMTVFVRKNNSYKAQNGYHDDLVMNIVLLSYFITTEYYRELCEGGNKTIVNEIREKKLKQMIDEEATMMNIYSSEDGHTENIGIDRNSEMGRYSEDSSKDFDE